MSRRRAPRAARAVLACALALALPAGAPAAEPPAPLRVSAAASLAEAFTEIARGFERSHPGVAVRLNLAGSQQLAAQLEHGAVADVFASADERWMEHVAARGLLAGEARTFARNRLVVIVPRTNPARIGRLQDLARRGVKLVLGADAVPVGRYSREALERLAGSEGFERDFARRVLANVVSEEENVRAVVGKVQLGEADAGIVYRSDVPPALERSVRTFELPEAADVIAHYRIAVLAGATRPEVARAFVERVLSSEGQAALVRRGLLPAAAGP